MIEVNPTRFKLEPWNHQLQGVRDLVNHPIFALWWEMRLGKTGTVINAACVLHEAELLDTLVIACPAQVKDVWLDRELGEINKHCYVPFSVLNYDVGKEEFIELFVDSLAGLKFIVTSVEFLRQTNAQEKFEKAVRLHKAVTGLKWMFVLDEASVVANYKALQTRACELLREDAPRVVLLDGTPVGNSNTDLYSKFHMLAPWILGYDNYFHFRAVHCKLENQIIWTKAKGKAAVKKLVSKVCGFQKLDIITRKGAPYCSRLEQKDCLDMPEKIPEFLTVNLSAKTWKVYCQMRDTMIADLDSGRLAVQHAASKSLRLAQICAGFLGGFTNDLTEETEVRELSDESTKAIVEWIAARRLERPDFKAVIYCRWRPEITRLIGLLAGVVPTAYKYGGNEFGLEWFHPDTQHTTGALLVAQPQATRYGYNFSRADTVVYLSSDYDRVTRSQSLERVQASKEQLARIGIQRQHILVLEVLVCGPKGEHTITWDIKRSIDTKETVANRTVAQWKRALEE